MRGIDSRRRFSPALTFGVALVLYAVGAQGTESPIPHGTLELIAENRWVRPGHGFSLGLHFRLEKGWHIYWINPGDSGEPPRVTWQLPPGFNPGVLEWPAPRRLVTSSIVDFGYEDAVTLIVPVHAETSLAAQPLAQLGADGPPAQLLSRSGKKPPVKLKTGTIEHGQLLTKHEIFD